MLVVLLIAAVLLALAGVRISDAADRAAIRGAIADAAAVIATARNASIHRRQPIAVSIDTVRGIITVHADTALLLQRDLWTLYAVRLSASRDSMAFDAHGLGIGAANLSLIVRRQRSVDTLFVSRLGRLRY
jgi:hypothetical protein